jgi:GDP-D-mannose 3', 5'-epimerase
VEKTYRGKIQMKTALVLGGAGFIGSHMVRKLKSEGYWIRSVDIKESPEYEIGFECDEYFRHDLRNKYEVERALDLNNDNMWFDEIYQFAADMGGAGYIFTGDHDASVMSNSASININVAEVMIENGYKSRLFYSSSACMYPAYNQEDPDNPKCSEDSAYPAAPDSEYGWEKLFSERLYLSFARNHGLDVRIGRYHNIFGPYGTWKGGKEKAPAAACRKISDVVLGREEKVVIWGDGKQTRSFLYIDDCIDATRRLMESNHRTPINIGSEEMVTINSLFHKAADIAKHFPVIEHDLTKPQGVRGRNSDNTIIREVLGWSPKYDLRTGMEKTYKWIHEQNKNAVVVHGTGTFANCTTYYPKSIAYAYQEPKYESGSAS